MPANDHLALRARIADAAQSVSLNNGTADLVTAALGANEGLLTAHGALAVTTGAFTGRSPKDKFIVEDALTRDRCGGTTQRP